METHALEDNLDQAGGMMTPKAELDAKIKELAMRRQVPLRIILGYSRLKQHAEARKEAYAIALDHYNGCWSKTAKYFNKHPTTLYRVLLLEKKQD